MLVPFRDTFPEVKEITSGIIKEKNLSARFKIEIGLFAQRLVGKTRQNFLNTPRLAYCQH